MTHTNLDMYDNTMIGKIAGVDMPYEDYKQYYNDATRDLNTRLRRIKSNYLIEKLLYLGTLEDFEYKYVYDASMANHTIKLIYNVLPAFLCAFLFSKTSLILFKIIAILLIVSLVVTIFYNIVYFVPILFKLKKKIIIFPIAF